MTEKKKKLESLLNQPVLIKEVKDVIENSSSVLLYIKVFKQAEMYNRAYKLLESRMKERNDLSLISPMIMNLCFSIELLLKSFIFVEKKETIDYVDLPNSARNIHKHTYSVLFKKIEKEHQRNILSDLSQRMGLPEINEGIFESILVAQNCDNSFAEWRYIFEQDGIKQLNIEFLVNLNESLGTQLVRLTDR